MLNQLHRLAQAVLDHPSISLENYQLFKNQALAVRPRKLLFQQCLSRQQSAFCLAGWLIEQFSRDSDVVALITEQSDQLGLMVWHSVLVQGRYSNATGRSLVQMCTWMLVHRLRLNQSNGRKQLIMMIKAVDAGVMRSFNEDFQLLGEGGLIQIKVANQYHINTLLYMLTLLIEQGLSSALYKNYYQYRKIIYLIRSFLLEVVLSTLRSLSLLGGSVGMSALNVLQLFFRFPFTVMLYEIQLDQDLRENSLGDIYYPSFIRRYFEAAFQAGELTLVLQRMSDTPQAAIKLLAITAKSISANSFVFDCEQKRVEHRRRCLQWLLQLLNMLDYGRVRQQQVRLLIQSLIRPIITFNFKVEIGMDLLQKYIIRIVSLGQWIVENFPLTVSQRQFNPLCKLFDLLQMLLLELSFMDCKHLDTLLRQQVLFLMNKFILNIVSRPLINDQSLYSHHGKFIKSLKECFKPFVKCAERFYIQSLSYAGEALLKTKPGQPAFIQMLGLVTSLLGNHSRSKQQEELRLQSELVQKLLQLLEQHLNYQTLLNLQNESLSKKNSHNLKLVLVCYWYIETLLNIFTNDFVLFNSDTGDYLESKDQLSRKLHQMHIISYDDLITFLLTKCLLGSCCTNIQIVTYCLYILKETTLKFKKQRHLAFDQVSFTKKLQEFFLNRAPPSFSSNSDFQFQMQFFNTMLVLLVDQNKPNYKVLLELTQLATRTNSIQQIPQLVGLLEGCITIKIHKTLLDILQKRLIKLNSDVFSICSDRTQGSLKILDHFLSLMTACFKNKQLHIESRMNSQEIRLTIAFIPTLELLFQDSFVNFDQNQQLLEKAYKLLNILSQSRVLPIYDILDPNFLKKVLSLPMDFNYQQLQRAQLYFLKRITQKNYSVNQLAIPPLLSNLMRAILADRTIINPRWTPLQGLTQILIDIKDRDVDLQRETKLQVLTGWALNRRHRAQQCGQEQLTRRCEQLLSQWRV